MNSIDNNIKAAFEVVLETHKSTQRLLRFCEGAAEKWSFVVLTPSERFLRWRSDKDVWGWNTGSIAMLFQSNDDPILENGYRDGAVFVLLLNLRDAQVLLAQFKYPEIASWSSNPISPADFWRIDWPIYKRENLDEAKSDFSCWDVKPKGKFSGVLNAKAAQEKEKYWGLQSFRGYKLSLSSITRETAETIIFGTFRELAAE